MYEDIPIAVLRDNEAISLGWVELFYGSDSNYVSFLLYFMFGAKRALPPIYGAKKRHYFVS